MNIIQAFIFTTLAMSQFLQASQSDGNSDNVKPSPAKNISSKSSTPKEKQPAQKQQAQKEKPTSQKQAQSKEKNPTSTPTQKKLKPSAASTAALLRQSATPGYIAPFEKMKKPTTEKTTQSNPILKKNPIFQTSAKVQNLGDVEIGNSSKKPIEITSITFSYAYTNSEEKNTKTALHKQTHKITFPRGHIIPPQKKLAFTITMKNHETLQFAGIKSIETYSGNVVFDHAITDLSKPIVLNYTKRGKIQYAQ